MKDDRPGQEPAPRAALEAALASHQAGRLGEAEGLYRQALERQPEDANALHLFGVLCHQRGEHARAAELIGKSVAINPGNAGAHYNLGIVLCRQGKTDEAIASFCQALVIEPRSAAAHNNLGLALAGRGDLDDAIRSYRKALEIDPNDGNVHNNLGVALQIQGKLEAAAASYEMAIGLNADFAQARLSLSAVLSTLGRNSEARGHLEDAIRLQPLVAGPCSGKNAPRAQVLKLSGLEAMSLQICDGDAVFSSGPTNTNVLLDKEEFSVDTYYVFEGNLLAADVDLPPFDIVVNAVVNPELETESLATVCKFIASRDVPVINDPRKIAATSREAVCKRLDGIESLVVPRTVREDLPRRDTSLFPTIMQKHGLSYPIIVRPVGGHVGSGMVRIDDESQFNNVLFFEGELGFHLIEYRDYRGDDGYFRKMRFFFVGGQMFAYHLAISDDWLIHHHTSKTKDNEWMKEEEEAFLIDYKAFLNLSQKQIAMFDEINRRMDLDFFGVDCALLKDGRFLLFESNPAMVLRLDDSPIEFPYKFEYVPKIAAAFANMVVARVRAS